MTQKPPAVPQSSLSRVLLFLCALVTIGVGAGLAASALGWLSGADVIFPNRSATLAGGVLLMVVGMIAMLASRWARKTTAHLSIVNRVTQWLDEWNAADDTITLKQRALNLILVSMVGLFFELALIRWLGTEVKVFAYLKNVVLIAAFLGLGLGFFASRRTTHTLPIFLPLATALVALVAVGVGLGLWSKIIVPSSEQIVLLGVNFSNMQAAPLAVRLVSWIPFYIVTIVFFVLVTLLFYPLGQYTGKCMRAFSPIPGYSMNLAGSLAGTLLFTLASFAWTPPVVWFGLVALGTLVLLRNSVPVLARMNWGMAIVFVLAFLVTPTQPGNKIVWSPYNQIVVSPMSVTDNLGREYPWGYQVSVGEYYYYQDLADLSPQFFQSHPDMPIKLQFSEYEVPYTFIRPNDVLILGAGGGNDVAAALRNGAHSVDAVDIDPAILSAGQEFHPEHPYASPNVHPFANDARAYIKNSGKQYDLVLFGLLDSYQVLSAFGAVRLDNFVYTVEGLRDAYALVKPDGMLVVTFELYEPWMGQRIQGILETVTGQKPTIIGAHHGTVFVVRKGTPISAGEVDTALNKLENQAKALTFEPGDISLTTDDWPFLYLRDRTIPLAYLTMLPILAFVAYQLIRGIGATTLRIQWHFFLLGAGFMLMEVRVIGQIALLFGSTWVVNIVAISAILLMALLANMLVAVRKIENVYVPGALLVITLVLSSIVPASAFLSLGKDLGGTLAALMLALPVFFSSIVFSTSFRKTTQVDAALASNLVGAILGGFVEYASLLWGIGSLAWIAVLLYVLALASARQSK